MRMFSLLTAASPTVSPTALPMVESNGLGDWIALAVALVFLGIWLISLKLKKPR